MVLPLLLLAMSVGCVEQPDAEPEFDFDAYFKTPSYYTVVSGDTLNKIAKKYSVSTDEVRRWNGLEGDLIEVDQMLLIWEGGEPAKRPARSARKRTRSIPEVAVASMGSHLPDDWEPPAMVSTAGIFGSMGVGNTGIGEANLDSTLASTQTVRADKVGPSTSLAGRGKIGGGEADHMSVSIGTRYNPNMSGGSTHFASTAVYAPRLSYPSRKRCLSGPSGSGLGDYGAVASKGLNASQIRGSLGGFVRHTAKCVPRGSSGAFSVRVELTVGCDGRVTEADVVSAGGAPSNVTACMEKTLGYAGFPAHDMPGGFTFEYPIHFGG